MPPLVNANPVVFETAPRAHAAPSLGDFDDACRDDISPDEVFDLIRSINDPEHPLSLEQLHITQLDLVRVDPHDSHVVVRFTPTIPHCSMATLIGLCIRVRLLRSLPPRFKVDIIVSEGSHQSELAVNRQLNDKERVAAALENKHLLEVVNQCLKTAIHTAIK